ncbi:MAG: hypothetical protein WC252_07285 [Candidatus Cloacimonadaceae bacterium]|jgi:hypothetical protein|nr:hypothetical protein [Candidatus Cloacimonadota bacterium]HCM14732.1 hypothetical protein [Candidatus Cloacimonas sp.]MCK9434694.1 hypothetical protein [Candidatus Cloacimonadota bacterium]MDD2615667.1 hypothetical protein [Candidatus Cloacimonadota bacterium]MDD2719010.1 hypothetical protein [Candidatus Cloacimonadota bacterium]
MLFTLSDGKSVDLSRIVRISSIRDFGKDTQTISLSKIGYTIHLDGREYVEVCRNYHFSDWAQVKTDLEKDRKDLISRWEAERKAK